MKPHLVSFIFAILSVFAFIYNFFAGNFWTAGFLLAIAFFSVLLGFDDLDYSDN